MTFTFLVENIGQEDVTLTSLTDTVFGDLNGQGDCVTGGLIPIGGSYSCSITVNLAADDLVAHYNLATAVGTDDDGTFNTQSGDTVTVSYDDALTADGGTATHGLQRQPDHAGQFSLHHQATILSHPQLAFSQSRPPDGITIDCQCIRFRHSVQSSSLSSPSNGATSAASRESRVASICEVSV